jgi:hypothetical protein
MVKNIYTSPFPTIGSRDGNPLFCTYRTVGILVPEEVMGVGEGRDLEVDGLQNLVRCIQFQIEHDENPATQDQFNE